MAQQEVKTYNPATGGNFISYVDVSEKKTCPHNNSQKIEEGPSMGHRDGDPDWEKHRCLDCGETFLVS